MVFPLPASLLVEPTRPARPAPVEVPGKVVQIHRSPSGVLRIDRPKPATPLRSISEEKLGEIHGHRCKRCRRHDRVNASLDLVNIIA